MLLEVTVEKRLVGEVKAESNFLHAVARGAELHLDFLDAAAVDDSLGRNTREAFHHKREVACGDRKAVGIELHLAPGAAVLENQGDELAQQFFLLRGMNCVVAKELFSYLII